jgi:O-antigen ligase
MAAGTPRAEKIGNATDIAMLAVLLVAIFWPVMPTPFMLDAATAWRYLCCAFAGIVLGAGFWRGQRLQATSFDYALAAYMLVVLATWPTSVDRLQTMRSIVRLTTQVAVFYGVRSIVSHRPAAGRLIVAATLAGVALLGWIATTYHFWAGITTRLVEFPPLEWNGRQGLSAVAAIHFALVVGIWQAARSRAVRISALVLIAGAAVELMFFYARDPWIAAIAVLGVAMVYAWRSGGIVHYAVGVAVMLVLIGALRTPYITHLARVAIGMEEGIEGGLPIRLGGWRDALVIAGRHPIAGIGLGNYAVVRAHADLPRFAMLAPGDPEVVHPHNAFLQQLAELGLFGGIAYAALWAIALSIGWRRARGNPTLAGLSLFYALVAIVVTNLGENMFLEAVAEERARYHTLAWLLLGVVIAQADGRPAAARPREVEAVV